MQKQAFNKEKGGKMGGGDDIYVPSIWIQK